jgi:hypothetical protein
VSEELPHRSRRREDWKGCFREGLKCKKRIYIYIHTHKTLPHILNYDINPLILIWSHMAFEARDKHLNDPKSPLRLKKKILERFKHSSVLKKKKNIFSTSKSNLRGLVMNDTQILVIFV